MLVEVWLQELLPVRGFLPLQAAILAVLSVLAPVGAEKQSPETDAARTLVPWSTESADGAYTVQGKAASRAQFESARLHNQGLLLMRANANQEALKRFKEAVQIFDGYAEVHHSMALAYAKLGRGQEAIAELRRATQLNPRLAESWLLLAGFYQTGGQTVEAANSYNEIWRRFPGSPSLPRINAALGLLYEKLARTGESVSQLKSSLEAKSAGAAATLTLAGYYRAQGNFAAAIETYCRYKERFPEDEVIPKINGIIDSLKKENLRQAAASSPDAQSQETPAK
jgi:tetratricopeptide (TPR) repeat protein